MDPINVGQNTSWTGGRGEKAHIESHLRGLHPLFGHGRTSRIPWVVWIVIVGSSSSHRTFAEEKPDPGADCPQKRQAADDTSGDGTRIRRLLPTLIVPT